MPPAAARRTRKYSASAPTLRANPDAARRSSWRRRMTRGANGHGSPRTWGSHWIMPSPGRHGAGMYERRSGMATMSGEEGDCPRAPAANPANPAPSATSPSMAETGTILAHGLPCRSTNMAKRNSTPSLLVAATSSSLVVIGPGSSEVFGDGTTRDVLIDTDRLLCIAPMTQSPCQQGCLMGNTQWFPLCCEVLPAC